METIMDIEISTLIAETDMNIACEIRDYLSSLGHIVYPIVCKGEELLEAAVSKQPNFIITDLHLAGQFDGIEAIARLGNIFKIPYIFITSFDDYSRLVNTFCLDPVCLICKPIKHDNLVQSVSRVIKMCVKELV
jgi:DNA-binding NarL/FixJ family response regulator